VPKPLRIAIACAAAGAVSVAVFNPAPIFDPAAWMVWAGEMVHLRLGLRAGPSWKPLPVIVASPFTIISWKFAATVWLWIVRSCAFGTSVLLWRLASRRLNGHGGPVAWAAGLVAAVLPFMIGDWVQLTLGGGSEPVLMALLLGAVELHLVGRWKWALALGSAAGLLRPEVWIFLGIYGLWLLYRKRQRALVPLALGAGAQVAAWFALPALLGADPMQASRHARAYVHNTVSLVEFARRTFEAMPSEIWFLAAIGVIYAVARRERVLLALTGAAGVWIAAVGAETFLGFAGIGRYSLPALVVFCALAGYGLGQCLLSVLEAGSSQRRAAGIATSALAIVLAAGAVLTGIPDAHARLQKVQHIDHTVAKANAMIAKAGGMKKLISICGPLGTSWSYSSSLAWSQRQTLGNISTRTAAPGLVLILDRAWSKYQPIPPMGTRTKQILISMPPWKIVKYEGDVTCADYIRDPADATRRMIERGVRSRAAKLAAERASGQTP